jgi:hypothetical protein
MYLIIFKNIEFILSYAYYFELIIVLVIKFINVFKIYYFS